MLKLYTLKTDYNNYLQNYDPLVMSNKDKKTKRPYIGILIKINEIEYYAPMTSPKPKHKKMNNSIDFEKINNGEYGAINFNNMIPVKNQYLNYIDISKIEDIQYKTLLNNQFIWINKNSNLIIKKAKKLYNLYIKNQLNIAIKSRCCNFPLLEEKCKEYSNLKYV